MRIWTPSTQININGNYGGLPAYGSIWFAGNGNVANSYSFVTSVYVNLSPSIPSCFVGFEIFSSTGSDPTATPYFNSWGQVTFIAGYGVNAGGTSLSPNNQNYEWYTNNGENNPGQPASIGFDGGNRRFGLGCQSIDWRKTHNIYGRVISNAIQFITISWT